MSDYQQAQQQLTEMIGYLRTHQSTDCAAADVAVVALGEDYNWSGESACLTDICLRAL